MENILLDDFILEKEENFSPTERDDLRQLLLEANLKVNVLEDQLTSAQSEIKFLREELSSTQVDLIKSRSEVKVLLEELGAYKTLQQPGQSHSGAQFPNLLLSSLDKLFEDKQQQLWLISGIQNSIDKLDTKIDEEIKTIDSKSSPAKPEETNKSSQNQISPEKNLVPTISKLQIKDCPTQMPTKKDAVTLHLELKKAYDFSPQSELQNKRSYPTPGYGTRTSFWTPTTPTPSHALRPSLSLHNLESKTFTEVLIPVIRPPERHEVSPHQEAALKISPSSNEKFPRRSYSVSDKNGFASFHKPTVPTVISPPAFRQIRSMRPAGTSGGSGSTPRSPPGSKSASPSPQTQHYKSFTAISRLSEISENVIYMECS